MTPLDAEKEGHQPTVEGSSRETASQDRWEEPWESDFLPTNGGRLVDGFSLVSFAMASCRMALVCLGEAFFISLVISAQCMAITSVQETHRSSYFTATPLK